MNEIRRTETWLARVGTLVLARSAAQPSADSFRGLQPPDLAIVSGTLTRSFLVSDDETHDITRPVLAAVHPG